MRRKLVVAFILLGTALIGRPGFSPSPLVHADPQLSGMSRADIVNADFTGAGQGPVGTPPANHDFESGSLSGWTGTATRQTGGPAGAYARATGALTSSSFLVPGAAQPSASVPYAQNMSVDLKVEGNGTYEVRLNSTVVLSGSQADSGTWGTKTFGVGNFVGQTVTLSIVPGPGSAIDIDNAGRMSHELPGWYPSGPRPVVRATENGVPYVSGLGTLSSTPLRLPLIGSTVGNDRVWVRVCYRKPSGTSLVLKRDGATIWSLARQRARGRRSSSRSWTRTRRMLPSPSLAELAEGMQARMFRASNEWADRLNTRRSPMRPLPAGCLQA